jgi:putative transcriptional regulator
LLRPLAAHDLAGECAERVSTLEALCEALECQPGEILEYVPDDPIDAAG